MRRVLAVVAVVALVALAGCSGGLSGDGSAGPDSGASAAAELPAVTEQTWTLANESVVFEALFQQHRSTLANASSYQFTRNLESETGSTTLSTIAVDHEEQRAMLSVESSSRDSDTTQIQETYVADSVVYSKHGTDSDPSYSRNDQNITGEQFAQFAAEQSRVSVSGGVPEALEFEYVGVEDGAYVFEADSISASERTSFDAANVTGVSSRLAVAPEGYVQEFSLTLVVDGPDGEQSADVLVETAGYNETTVTEPDWTDKTGE